ncbi:MAG: 4Fe-4S binding protein [Magnetococcales bacterium]|nr:4Fe-4S binding protein [Magnetococcales bacterium]NGZ06621.1 4Fe-4S binding protein [Magnetococcales bacterium]
MSGLRGVRRVYAVFFVGLFVFFLWSAGFGRLQGYDVELLLQLDPLTALAGVLTSHTLYQGLAFALVILIPTLFLGRFFCSWICPLGILNQAVSHLWHRRRAVEAWEENRYRPLYRLKYYLLVVMLVFAAFGSLQIGLLDPIALIYRSFSLSFLPAVDHVAGGWFYTNAPVFQGGVLIGGILLLILLANRFITRFWCRALCPLGALLGWCSQWSVLRIRRDVDACNQCKQCLKACQGAADPDGAVRVTECHLCMNCIEACGTQALHYGLARERSSIGRPLDINRRRVVESALAAVVAVPVTKSSLSVRTAPAPEVIRPPGSLPEPQFLARCIKCGLCMRICPTNVLQPALLESGFEGLWTPILMNGIGYCEHHCVLCGQVCPTAAIRPVTVAEKVGAPPFTQPIRLGTAFFDRGRCLPWSMDVPCIVCEETCPTSPKAIWYEMVMVKGRDGRQVALKRPFVQPDLCIGCGICENKCPVADLAAIRVTSVGETRSRDNRMLLHQQAVIQDPSRADSVVSG